LLSDYWQFGGTAARRDAFVLSFRRETSRGWERSGMKKSELIDDGNNRSMANYIFDQE
jgi:hypothetical protein